MSTADRDGLESAPEAEREIVMTRVLTAPRERVWRAWTEEDRARQWYGPEGFTVTSHGMDVRPGGVWRFTMHGPDGADYPNRMLYREARPPERLVYDHDDDGAGEQAFRVTVTFEPVGEGTRVTMRLVFPTVEARDATVSFGAVELGQQTLGKLAAHLAAER